MRNSEFAANLALAASRNVARPQSPRIIRNASRAAARVPSFASLAHLAARGIGCAFALAFVAGGIL